MFNAVLVCKIRMFTCSFFFFLELIAVKIYHVYEQETTTETLFELDLQHLFWLAVKQSET